ncbi:transcriptional regulator PadR family protein [Halorubrum coriense DSM 10284]|uniref:Transcriptional regulator PadR family protein n=1 Tax=Halorubrum coriense DSM 10284 TaxID=1227466 RepID=M0ECJ7_9EURY|nr:PadR family transcriptional regulator [Halorubrum coriense]ELZ44597.1 transcriptional regulator PadR family protein [Halorubrum coriense DSM 10284]
MDDLTAFQRDMLFVIAGHEKPHGLKIKNMLENYYEDEVNHGRLYPNLDDLVDEGLINKGEKDKRTNWYTLSAQGIEVLNHRRNWEDQFVEQHF